MPFNIDPADANPDRPSWGYGVLRTGVCIGLAGGLAEIAVVWTYLSLTGGNAAIVARGVAAAIGMDGASAIAGVAVHMWLAVALGIGLAGVIHIAADRVGRARVMSAFMLGSLVTVWGINFFIVLPVVSPSFVHLLPYALTLASKLAFGLAAAATYHACSVPAPSSDRKAHQGKRSIARHPGHLASA